MSRFLTGLAVIPTFKAAEIGLAEWVALCALAEADGIGNKQLAKRLGVTGQRVNQVTNELVDAGLISIDAVAGGRAADRAETDRGRPASA